jgi:tRNA nucleotidyltransferase (CCA-adding enzyme)
VGLAVCGPPGRRRRALTLARDAPARAAAAGAPLPVRFAVLAWGLEEDAVRALCGRLRAPNEERELALVASRCRALLGAREPRALLELLKRADALRRPERFALLLQAVRLADPAADLTRVEQAFAAAAAVDAGAIARASSADIGARVEQAREAAIGKALASK